MSFVELMCIRRTYIVVEIVAQTLYDVPHFEIMQLHMSFRL